MIGEKARRLYFLGVASPMFDKITRGSPVLGEIPRLDGNPLSCDRRRFPAVEMKTARNNPNRLTIPGLLAQRCHPLLGLATGSRWSRKYDLTISHQHRFIWFRVPKNGTSTFLKSMESNGVALDVVEAHMIRYPLRAYHDYYKFAVVRNPWDRLVSCWHNKILQKNRFRLPEDLHRRLHDFSAFVDYVSQKNIERCDTHIASQSSLVDLDEVDHLIRMESYEEGVAHVFRTIGFDSFEIRSSNRTPTRKHYAEYYTDETREKVGRIYEKDIRNFNYRF